MTDKYTAEQMHTVGLYLRSKGYKQAGEMLRQAARMMRERNPSIDASTHEFWDKQRDRQLSDAMSTDGRAGQSIDRNKREVVKVTDADVHEAVEAYVISDKAVEVPRFEAMRAALESFIASRAAVPEGLLRWVKAQADDPDANERFRELYAMLAAAPEVTK